MEHYKKNPFELERYFARYEFSAPHLLCCSDCEPLKMSELLDMADSETRKLWENLSLGYTESQGLPLLREEIAGLYDHVSAEGVILGAPQELIFLGISAMLSAGDHAIVTSPGYQSLYESAAAAGADVSRLDVTADSFSLVDAVMALLRPNTKLLVLNLPHNPSGYHANRTEFDSVIEICRARDMVFFCDEMYRWLELDDGAHLPSACEMYHKAVTLCGVSKAFGLPGLRLGWLASQDPSIIMAMVPLKDYTTICCSAPSEILSLIAIRARARIFERNKAIIRKNLQLVQSFFVASKAFRWRPP